MSKWFKYGIVGMFVVGAVAVLITGVALAQDQTPATPTTPTTPQQGLIWGVVSDEVSEGRWVRKPQRMRSA